MVKFAARYLMKLLIGRKDTFPGGQLYRIFPAIYDLDTSIDPCEFPTTRLYDPLSSDRYLQERLILLIPIELKILLMNNFLIDLYMILMPIFVL